MSSPNISLNSPTASYTSFEKPILKVRGTNFSILVPLEPLIPPVVRKDVIEKLIAFCKLLKDSSALSGPP